MKSILAVSDLPHKNSVRSHLMDRKLILALNNLTPDAISEIKHARFKYHRRVVVIIFLTILLLLTAMFFISKPFSNASPWSQEWFDPNEPTYAQLQLQATVTDFDPAAVEVCDSFVDPFC